MDAAPHIAVVDDHRDIRDLVGKYLTKHGYRVSVAENGARFGGFWKRSPSDLIVLDIMMPGEDGLSLCRQCGRPHEVPVIFLPP